jgi:signal transduction histidine kinase
MRVHPKFRLVVTYVFAVTAPVAVAIGWTAFHPLLQGVPGYFSLLAVALIARFLGFRAAIAATASFAAVLWFYVLPIVFADRSLAFLLIRLLLFVSAAAVVASLSRQAGVKEEERDETARRMTALSSRLLHLQDDERRRIARQLHDTTAQNLAALKLNLARMQKSLTAPEPVIRELLDQSITLTGQSIGEIRTLTYLLHPPMIEEAGLLPSLRWYVTGFETRSGIPVVADFPEELGRLPLDLETATFRIVQEGLSNIQRHSGSAVARIGLEQRADTLHLKIEDEGRGIPLHLRGDDVLLAASGVGIAGMRERVRELGGRIEIQSRDHGTVVTVTLPLPKSHRP